MKQLRNYSVSDFYPERLSIIRLSDSTLIEIDPDTELWTVVMYGYLTSEWDEDEIDKLFCKGNK